MSSAQIAIVFTVVVLFVVGGTVAVRLNQLEAARIKAAKLKAARLKAAKLKEAANKAAAKTAIDYSTMLYGAEFEQIELETDLAKKTELANALAAKALLEQVVIPKRGEIHKVYEYKRTDDKTHPVFQYTLDVTAPANYKPTGEAFYVFKQPDIATAAFYRHQTALKDKDTYSFESDLASFSVVDVLWHTYPMNFTSSKPMYLIKRQSDGAQRLVGEEVAPTGWERFSETPTMWVPVPVGEKFGVGGLILQ